jgi:uncharacterized membrane protein (UPF0182 family)
MYTLFLVILLAIAGVITYSGVASQRKAIWLPGILLGIFTVLFFWFMGFWGELLWFRNLGFSERFWTIWSAKAWLSLSGFIICAIFVFALTSGLKGDIQKIRYLSVIIAGATGAILWTQNWEIFLKFFNRVPTNDTEPVLKLTTSFYLFVYPFLRVIYSTFLYSGLIALAANLLPVLQPALNEGGFKINVNISLRNSIFFSAGVVLIILGVGKYLNRFGLFFLKKGAVFGPGWTDVHIRLPMLMTVSVITILTGIIMFIPSARNRVLKRITDQTQHYGFAPLIVLPGIVFIIWIILLTAIPLLFQSLKVEPNEISLEKPYLENNIEFTRRGFKLNNLKLNEFPVTETFKREDVEKHSQIFSNIRLWDYRALDAVFKQFQEIRLYYKFNDVDIDRYQVNGAYREVMISAREMDPASLPATSQTFVNTHFIYTHGYGIVLTPVNKFTPDGLPDLIIKNIPPVSSDPGLAILQPAIYYGELTNSYVVTNSKQAEFDYPGGENNIYTSYKGKGGVQLSNFWRKLIYGWKMGGSQFLLTSYTTHDTRIMFHRQIIDRVRTLAPFLYFDDDPYIVTAGGKLYWIIDAYTTSKNYPYSEPFSSSERIGYTGLNEQQNLNNLISEYLTGTSYLRNAVKIVVNAYSGEVDFYIFDEDDPLVQVYDKMFPGLFKKKSEMPEDLRQHVRYPSDMLLAQALVYSKYHMTDPEVFYNQEDLWVRATEKYYSNIQPVEPYYIMWEKPESGKLEFILMLPFTPKDKQVLVGWLAGLCDGDDYGKLMAFVFPKEKRVLGTQQVETKIDQDSFLSGQLSLWDQRGSNVIRGNVLVIPLDKTVLYVEPIYLQSQTAAYPELRLVVVMSDDKMAYATTFDAAINNFFASPGAEQIVTNLNLPSPAVNLDELIKKANQSFEDYLQLMQQKRFNDAGNALNDLQQALQQLSDRSNAK